MNAIETSENSENKLLRRASLVSNVLHPWAVLVPVVALATYQEVSEPFECIKWTLLTLAPAFILPFLYAKIR